MKKEFQPMRIQRIDRLCAVMSKGHDVLVGNHRIARVVGLGDDDFGCYLYDDSQANKVVQHICRLAAQRRKVYADAVCWDDSFESGPLVA